MSEDHHFGEGRRAITGAPYKRAVRRLAYFMGLQRGLSDRDQYSGTRALGEIMDSVNEGRDWLRVSEEALILSAERRWKEERAGRRAQEAESEAGRSEILRGLGEL